MKTIAIERQEEPASYPARSEGVQTREGQNPLEKKSPARRNIILVAPRRVEYSESATENPACVADKMHRP
jgi:hypothetical protein